jgi:hypothetical protein
MHAVLPIQEVFANTTVDRQLKGLCSGMSTERGMSPNGWKGSQARGSWRFHPVGDRRGGLTRPGLPRSLILQVHLNGSCIQGFAAVREGMAPHEVSGERPPGRDVSSRAGGNAATAR